MKPKTLIEVVSPNGNVQAFVEQDDRVAYFYLWGGPESEFGTRSCWVRNLIPGYKDQNEVVSVMRTGTSPMLNKAACKHPEGAEPLIGNRLKIVWFEEGDAAGLMEDGELLAVIPGWSGHNGFSGYSRDCNEMTPICWPLDEALDTLQARIDRAQEYWDSWNDDETPWHDLQDSFMCTYKSLGDHSNYYAIDGDEWPPKAMLKIPTEEGTVLVTLGVSIRPMPGVEGAFDDPSPHRRVELGICLGQSYTGDEDIMQMARYISGQSGLPWANFTWLGDGHTIPCDSVPGGEASGFTSVLLLSSPPGAPDLKMPTFNGDDISVM